MIEPGGIPQYTGDFGQLEKAASALRTHATGIRNGGRDIHSRFQATAAYYKAPEAEKLFSSTRPVMDTADEFAGNIESLADALDTFIHEAKPHADRLKQLKLDAIGFVDSVRGDDDWTEDEKKTDAHQALMDGVAAACEGFQEAERNAANKINAISPGACRPAWITDDGTHGLGMYGQSAGALKDMKDLPWGSPEGRTYERWSLEWWGHGAKSWAWDGIAKDSIWGGIDGLGTLIGFHGGEARDQAWDGLRRTAVGGYAYGMDLFGQDEHLSDWQRDSKPYAKEFGKQFIAYDMANEDPARAHAVVSFNILTLATGPFAAAAKLGKGGTIAKAAGTMAKIGDALDPLSGTFKAAKALSGLPKVSQVLANVSDHLQIPKTRFPDGTFDLDSRYRVDKDGKFVPLDPDGKPNLDPARHEPSAAERGAGRPNGDREPVGVGGRAPGATAHAGDGLPPRGGHDAGGGSGSSHTAGTARGEAVPGHGTGDGDHGADSRRETVDRNNGAESGNGDGAADPSGAGRPGAPTRDLNEFTDQLLAGEHPLSAVPPSARGKVAEELSRRYGVPKEAMNHVLFGEVKDFKPQGWHAFDEGMPDRKIIPDTIRKNPDNTINAQIVMRADNGDWLQKVSTQHTFFPEHWTVKDIAEVARNLEEAPLKKGKAKITYDGVRVVGLFNKGSMTTFFPGG
ncbi:EndoU domain-containing protein [Streptomyces sp. NPDC048295]|uniref:EndoU domain-containing protein n=1 Tax=Streptomyces sp. NPDC048295 TaxID=3154617 RepID=UPI00342376CB